MAELTHIPESDIHVGGPGIQPSPAWFYYMQLVWFRCQCGDLITLPKTVIKDNGVLVYPLAHACGYVRDVVLDGWRSDAS